LHIDDVKALEYIREMLGIGQIYYSKQTGTYASFVVKNFEDIKFIIEIFSKNPLNTIKHLNFLDFKKAFELYINSKRKITAFNEIEAIIGGINSKRTNFENDNKFKITSY
jgi:hypothetical protein